MTRYTTRLLSALAALGLVWTLGCAQPAQVEHPPTHPVSGTVTYKGNPVAGAQVVFKATEGGQGAVGTTDADGKYSMTTYESGDGAQVGEYGVKITKTGGAAAGGEETEEEYTGAKEDDYWVPENELPAKYADPSTSELTATVAEGSNTIDFELTD